MNTSHANTPADNAPPQIPDHELIRRIGSGGFGDVWLATNRTTGQLRAVKLIPLRRHGESDPAGREIVSLTRLEESVRGHHPHLLRIHHVGQTEAFLFYVMEPADDVAGGPASSAASYRPATLRSRLQQGPLPSDECSRYGRQLLEGLASLHSSGMVHRDVKPANCLFVDGELKLADFGLLTADGPQVSRVGTRGYMPPDGRMDARADVYAAGLVLYETLTGLPPEEFPSLGPRAREIAADPTLAMLNRLVLGACEPDPARRFAGAGAMLAEMRDPVVPATVSPGAWRRGTTVALACLLVAAVVTTMALWPPGERRGPAAPAPAPAATASGGVDVNFISEPAGATIHVDGKLLVDADGTAFETPCTVPGMTPGLHHVVFKHAGRGDLDAGEVRLGDVREVEVSWDAPGEGKVP